MLHNDIVYSNNVALVIHMDPSWDLWKVDVPI